MKILIGIVVILILAFTYMRFSCTGLFEKVRTYYTDAQGNDFDKTECRFKGFNK